MDKLLETLASLEPLAVLASAAAITLVGILWYSQPLFGRAFIRLSGIRPGDLRPEHVRRTTIVSFLTAIIYALLLGIIAKHSYNNPAMIAAAIVFIWLFIMLSQLNGFLFRREPFALFLLTTLRSLVTLMAGGLVFTLWS